MKKDRPILLVEDDKVDVMTVKRALREIRVSNPVHVTSNGEEALEFLLDPENPRPEIILLDINMPKMNGIEFLEHAKTNPDLRSIPVIVLTTSEADRDRFETFEQGVAGYMVKPVDYAQFVNTMRTIHVYWTLSKGPPSNGETKGA